MPILRAAGHQRGAGADPARSRPSEGRGCRSCAQPAIRGTQRGAARTPPPGTPSDGAAESARERPRSRAGESATRTHLVEAVHLGPGLQEQAGDPQMPLDGGEVQRGVSSLQGAGEVVR